MITRIEIRDEIQMTEKQPRKESARIAATIGSKLVEAAAMLNVWVASMLLTWNFSIMYTIKLFAHPDTAMLDPISAPVFFFFFHLLVSPKIHGTFLSVPN